MPKKLRILKSCQTPTERWRIISYGLLIIATIALICMIVYYCCKRRSNTTPVLSLDKSIQSDLYEQRKILTDQLLKKRQQGDVYSEEESETNSFSYIGGENEGKNFIGEIGENLTSENTIGSQSIDLRGSVKSLTLEEGASIGDVQSWSKIRKKQKLKKTKTQIS